MILKRKFDLEDYKGISIQDKKGRKIVCWYYLNKVFNKAKNKK